MILIEVRLTGREHCHSWWHGHLDKKTEFIIAVCDTILCATIPWCVTLSRVWYYPVCDTLPWCWVSRRDLHCQRLSAITIVASSTISVYSSCQMVPFEVCFLSSFFRIGLGELWTTKMFKSTSEVNLQHMHLYSMHHCTIAGTCQKIIAKIPELKDLKISQFKLFLNATLPKRCV